jgi:hypothetical protein
LAGNDYTYAQRQRKMRAKRKASGLAEVRERVPPDLVPVLKAIAAEMRDPEKAEEYRKRFPESESQTAERTTEDATNPDAL